MSAIRELPTLEASALVMETARVNCAAALREKGEEVEAVKFETGERDFAWRFRHEVMRLQGEGLPGAPQ